MFLNMEDNVQVPYTTLYRSVIEECRKNTVDKMDMQQFINCIDELEYYSFFHVFKNKRDQKSSLVSLKVDLKELESALDKQKEEALKM